MKHSSPIRPIVTSGDHAEKVIGVDKATGELLTYPVKQFKP